MPIHPMSDINDYIKLKKPINNQNDSERSGEQLFQKEQTKSFQPLINVQKETSKSIKDNMAAGQELTVNTLLPLVQEMQRRNDQIDMLASQPFHQAQIEPPTPIAESTPEKKPTMLIDFDKDLNTTDRENLEEMKLKLPSIVFSTNTYEEVIDDIKKQRRSVGQYLGKGPAGRKIDSREKKYFESKQSTLKKYQDILETSEPARSEEHT